MSETDPVEAARTSLKRIALAVLRDEARADDVLQEAWLMSRTCKPSDYEDERAWLAGVVRNLARNARRGERALARRERAASRSERLEATSEIVSRRSVVEHLRAAVGRLPETERSALELRFFEELELAQIAARLGRPIPTLKSQIQRGLERLRGDLRAELGDSRAWCLGLIAAFDWEEAELRAALGSTGGGLSLAWLWACGAAMVVASALVLWVWSARGGAADAVARGTRAPTVDVSQLRGPRAAGRDVAEGGAAPSATALVPAGSSTASEVADERPEGATPVPPVLELLVVDGGGRPVAGADVLLARAQADDPTQMGELNRARGRSDAEGHVRIELEPGERLPDRGFGEFVHAIATVRGFAASQSYSIPLRAAAAGRIRVVLDAPEVVLEGRALDAEGRPIALGRVILQAMTSTTPHWSHGVLQEFVQAQSEPLDTDGSFRFEHARQGPYLLIVVDPRTGMDCMELDLAAAGLHVQDVVQADGLLLRGRVLDPERRPVEGAQVWFEFALRDVLEDLPIDAVRTAEDGTFEIPGLSGTVLRLWARSVRDGGMQCAVDLRPEALSAEQVLVLERRAAVQIEVSDREGAPRPGVSVVLRSVGLPLPRIEDEGTTDDAGRVLLRMPSGSDGAGTAAPLDLVLMDSSRTYALPEQVQPLERSTEHVRITFDPPPPGSIEGNVRVEGWERPFDLRLALLHTSTGVSVAVPLPVEGGPFSVGPVPPGRYELLVEGRESLLARLGTVEVRSAAALDVGAVVLPRPGAVVLEETSPAGDSARAPRQFVVLRDGTHAAWVSDALREGPLELLPGDYVLSVISADGSRRSQPFAIESGAERWVVVEP